MSDLIDRQAAIDAPEKFIKDCNPEHFVGHQKFIEYMDNTEIGSFGNWQFANGFNMGLTAAEVAIKKLPSAQPTHDDGSNALDALDCVAQRTGKWIVYYHGGTRLSYECNLCRHSSMDRTPFCSYCGARMETENDIVEN